MKAGKKAIRILIILLTATWGVFLGILAPLIIARGEDPIFRHYVMDVWLIAGIIGYIIPCFLVMLNVYKTAAGFSIAGTVMYLYVHGVMMSLRNREQDYYEASFMYLPQIFMTVMTILNIYIMSQISEKKKEQRNAKAPSILDKRED